jgi:hypothetical protein
MYEIRIDPGPETGDTKCQEPGCPFCATAAGRAEIIHIQYEAAQHAMATGHAVTEHWGGTRTVSQRRPPRDHAGR